MSLVPIEINIPRLIAELEELARFNEAEPPAVTRILFTSQDLAARAWIKGLFEEAGLTIRVDAIGNTFARWKGSRPGLPAVATGSHIDAIPGAGIYDGTVGVLGAIEAIRALQRTGYRPARSIELIMFTSEEPTRFGLGCLGSRSLAGFLKAEAIGSLLDADSRTLDEIRREAGFEGPLDSVALPDGHYSAFIELHIEQGVILEREGLPIGVVEAIAAPAALRVEIVGEGGHAGTVLMPDRRDALCGAAEIVLAVEAAARGSTSVDSVATAGVCRVLPGAVNGIPARVLLEIDVRDIEAKSRDRVITTIHEDIARIASARHLSATVQMLNADAPARSAPEIIEVIEASCQELGLPHRRMVSRAYHDALFMARLAPTAMVFIPCRSGYSHRPEEYSSPEAIAAGTAVLAYTLARLASDAGDEP
jgi:ureidoglycolate amidohydrolase